MLSWEVFPEPEHMEPVGNRLILPIGTWRWHLRYTTTLWQAVMLCSVYKSVTSRENPLVLFFALRLILEMRNEEMLPSSDETDHSVHTVDTTVYKLVLKVQVLFIIIF